MKIDEFAAGDELAALQGRLVSEQKAHQRTRRELSRTQERVDELEHLMRRWTVADPSALVEPKWLKAKRSSKTQHSATALLLLSDLHLDEVVKPEEINGVNAYNRAIAEQRLWNVIESTINMCDNYVAGVKLDGIVCALLGDVLTGDIHDELARTNEAPVMASVSHWVPFMAAALKRLADAFGSVYVPCVDGNHDRFHHKMPAKQRAESSVAWVFYNWLATMCADDERITFSITPSPEQIVSIYDTRFLLTHGDSFRSAGGVGGIFPALLKFLLRKHAQFEAVGQPWDVCLMGHWHQLLFLPDVIVNGTTKGMDEWSAKMGFGFEPPRQALAIVTPERGITQQMAVYAD